MDCQICVASPKTILIATILLKEYNFDDRKIRELSPETILVGRILIHSLQEPVGHYSGASYSILMTII